MRVPSLEPLEKRLKVPGIVQKYAVVDANHVFASLGATWGNVARFPGALGRHGTRRNRPFEAAIRDAQKRGKPNAHARPGSCKQLPHAQRC